MAWTAPMTAVSNAIFTASQFNTYIRDNLLETAPAKAATAGGYFVATGANAIAQRVATTTTQPNSGTTTSTSFTATLAGTPGTNPAVTVSTGTSALVIISADISTATAIPAGAFMSFAVSGATTIAASDTYAAKTTGTVTVGASRVIHLTNLNAGSNVFTLQYHVTSGPTGTYANRSITVVPF